MIAYRIGIAVLSLFKSIGSGFKAGVPDLEDTTGEILKYRDVPKEVRLSEPGTK